MALILGFALTWGLIVLFQYRASPFFRVPVVDEESYVSWGQRIAAGEVLGQELFYQDPLYPYFLGLVFWVFGENFLVVRLLQLLMGLVSIGLVFWMGAKLGNERVGLLSALFLALSPGLYFFMLLLLKASLVLFFSALVCALGVRALSSAVKRLSLFGVGVSLGLLSLLRGNVLLLCPLAVLLVFYFSPAERSWPRLQAGLLVALGVMVVLMPVAWRNYLVSHELVLTTTQAGPNFYLGNCESANGRYVNLPFVRAHPRWEADDFQREASRRVGRELSRKEVSRFWLREGLKWLANHPGSALRLYLHKLRLLLHNYEIPDNQSLYLLRELFVPALYLPFLGLGFLWGPALVGMWWKRRDRRAVWPAAFVLLYSLSLLPFFIVDRYRMALLPGLALFAALFLEETIKKLRSREWKKLVLPALFLALVFLASFYPTPESRSPAWGEYLLLGDAYLEGGEPGPALTWYGRVLRTHPQHPEIFSRWQEAVARCSRRDLGALAAEADHPETTSAQLKILAQKFMELGESGRSQELLEKARATP